MENYKIIYFVIMNLFFTRLKYKTNYIASQGTVKPLINIILFNFQV